MNQCPQCGNELVYKQGVSKKNGRPYSGWVCSVRECGFAQWDKQAQGQQAFPAKQQVPVYQTQPTDAEFILEKLSQITQQLTGILKAVEHIANEPTRQSRSQGPDVTADSERSN